MHTKWYSSNCNQDFRTNRVCSARAAQLVWTPSRDGKFRLHYYSTSCRPLLPSTVERAQSATALFGLPILVLEHTYLSQYGYMYVNPLRFCILHCRSHNLLLHNQLSILHFASTCLSLPKRASTSRIVLPTTCVIDPAAENDITNETDSNVRPGRSPTYDFVLNMREVYYLLRVHEMHFG